MVSFTGLYIKCFKTLQTLAPISLEQPTQLLLSVRSHRAGPVSEAKTSPAKVSRTVAFLKGYYFEGLLHFSLFALVLIFVCLFCFAFGSTSIHSQTVSTELYLQRL